MQYGTVLRRLPLIGILAQFAAACSPNADPEDSGVDLTVLTLNLHTYQELRTAGTTEAELTDELALQRIEAYGPVFDRIAAGIGELDPDVICFQEVGEWSGGAQADPESVVFGSTHTNMIHQILSRLGKSQYYYTMDWSHYGWDVWLEGSAILSKYPIDYSASRFISGPGHRRRDFWKSRNVPMAKMDIPQIGGITVLSVHAGWPDDAEEPFQEQYRRLLEWAEQAGKQTPTTIFCGDFNVPAGSPTYQWMTEGAGYSDQYLLANPDGMLDATIRAGADGWESDKSGRRIDYVLMREDSPLEVVRARRVFTEHDLGRVSDHVGVFVEFKAVPPR